MKRPRRVAAPSPEGCGGRRVPVSAGKGANTTLAPPRGLRRFAADVSPRFSKNQRRASARSTATKSRHPAVVFRTRPPRYVCLPRGAPNPIYSWEPRHAATQIAKRHSLRLPFKPTSVCRTSAPTTTPSMLFVLLRTLAESCHSRFRTRSKFATNTGGIGGNTSGANLVGGTRPFFAACW